MKLSKDGQLPVSDPNSTIVNEVYERDFCFFVSIIPVLIIAALLVIWSVHLSGVSMVAAATTGNASTPDRMIMIKTRKCLNTEINSSSVSGWDTLVYLTLPFSDSQSFSVNMFSSKAKTLYDEVR
jgi:hypothetical protein